MDASPGLGWWSKTLMTLDTAITRIGTSHPGEVLVIDMARPPQGVSAPWHLSDSFKKTESARVQRDENCHKS